MNPVPRVGVGALIVNGEHQVLLARRLRPPEAGHWGIFGGKVEYQEPLAVTVQREVKEETGLDVKVTALLCVTDHILPDEDCHWVSPAYLCAITGGTVEHREPEALGELAWFSPDQLPAPLTLTARNALAAYAQGQFAARQGTISLTPGGA